MAITQDGSTPAVVTKAVTSATLAMTTAPFSPPAGALLAAIVQITHAGGTAPSVAMSSGISGNPAWTTGPVLNALNNNWAGIYYLDLPSAQFGITVTVTDSTSLTQAGQLTLLVLDGAASNQSGAGSNTASGTSTTFEGSLTTTQAGSTALVSVAVNGFETVTPSALTTTLANDQVTGGASLLAGQQTNATVTPGATTLGWTGGVSQTWAWVALEILPAAAPAAVPGQAAAVRARSLPRRAGRVASNRGALVRNPASGPVFRQAWGPARIRAALPRRGRISTGSPGAPVQNPPPPPPPGIPGIYPGPVWFALFKPQWPRPRPPAPPAIGVPPVFAVGNIALGAPLAFSGTAANAGLQFLFLGPYAVYYLDYEDTTTQEVLHCVPGQSYSMFVASGRAPGLLDPPRDGRWLGYPAYGFMAVFGPARESEYARMLHKGRAANSARLARLARGEKPAPEEAPGLPEITCEGRISIPPPGVSA